MYSRKYPRESCAACGAELVSRALFDEYAEDYFCDDDCFEEWSDHTRKPSKYYKEHNVHEIEISE